MSEVSLLHHFTRHANPTTLRQNLSSVRKQVRFGVVVIGRLDIQLALIPTRPYQLEWRLNKCGCGGRGLGCVEGMREPTLHSCKMFLERDEMKLAWSDRHCRAGHSPVFHSTFLEHKMPNPFVNVKSC
ncbi:hypothetical protein AVEN_47451-1 [Araneus ventricosus]|uniref:Uncharacterized protein n=1 Tax=Araneus ventricosus TaxID=182803 RepID=A0A4Y2IST2_ARAVE|nr:hypothetical protein AVEN_47451-1 [Araneus ventricosus]